MYQYEKRNMPINMVPKKNIIQSGKNNRDETFAGDPVIISFPIG